MWGVGVALAAMLIATPLAAQRGARQSRASVAPPQGRVEALLGLRERLELTEQQVDQLNSLREARLQEATALMSETLRMRSDLAAGEVTRDGLALPA